MSRLVENLREIRRQKITYVTPGNLKRGITLYGVTGSLDGGASSLQDVLLENNIFDKTNLPWILPGFTIDLTTKEVVSVSELSQEDFLTVNTLFTIPKPSDDNTEWVFNIQNDGYLYIPTRNLLYLLNSYSFLLYPDPNTNTLKIQCIYNNNIYKIKVPEDITNIPLYKFRNEEDDNVELIEYNAGDIVDEIELDEDDKLYICTTLPITNYKESGETDPETGDPLYTYDYMGSFDLILPMKGSAWEAQQNVYMITADDNVNWGDMYPYILNLNSVNTRVGRCVIETEPSESTNLNGYFVKRFTDDDYILSDFWWILKNTLNDNCANYISINCICFVLGVILNDQDASGTYEIFYETGGVFKLQNIYQSDLFFYISPIEDNIMSTEYPDQVEEYGYKLFMWGDYLDGFIEIEGEGSADVSEALELTNEIIYEHPSSGIDHTIPEPQPER